MTIYFELEFEDMDRWQEYKKANNADDKKLSRQLLNERKVNFSRHNDDEHLIIVDSKGNRRIDFWPSTGAWKDRNAEMRGRGTFNLLRYIRK